VAPNRAQVTRYYYSNQRIIEERTGRDAVQATYTYGMYIDEPLTMDRGGERFYYHSNKQFSTYALTDSAGQIVERYSYTPYGETTTFNSSYQNAGLTSRVGNPFTFTGRELDAETGLMHFRARTYDAVQGRFKRRDPIGYADGMNLYGAYFIPHGLDPTGTDSPGCDFVPEVFETPCILRCCAKHDECYNLNCCTSESWRDWPQTKCAKCNYQAVACVLRCIDTFGEG
jgi:RHS repeat-associated protein